MIDYDVVVIGGGLAGFSSALRCIERGLKTAVVSHGQSAMHFSSGSIDVLSHSPTTGEAVSNPFDEIAELAKTSSLHPYAKLGEKRVFESLSWFQQLMSKHGLPLKHQDSMDNHYRISSLGTLKSTWLSQPYVWQLDHKFAALNQIERVILVSIEGFRDFQPEIAKAKLASLPMFAKKELLTVKITLDTSGIAQRNCHEFRSIDVSRLLRQEADFASVCSQLRQVATPNDLVLMPSILGNGDGLALMEKLAAETHLKFHEVPTMPPSLLGIRIEDTLRRAFIEAGGALHVGDEVTHGVFKQDGDQLSLACLYTRKMRTVPINTKFVVLASGSFFSKGLKAEHHKVIEPIFDLDIEDIGGRESWYSKHFFSRTSHPFMNFGVSTNRQFKPLKAQQCIDNVYCAGSILAHYDPIAHGCGGGVAISTGFHVADAIADSQESACYAQKLSHSQQPNQSQQKGALV